MSPKIRSTKSVIIRKFWPIVEQTYMYMVLYDLLIQLTLTLQECWIDPFKPFWRLWFVFANNIIMEGQNSIYYRRLWRSLEGETFKILYTYLSIGVKPVHSSVVLCVISLFHPKPCLKELIPTIPTPTYTCTQNGLEFAAGYMTLRGWKPSLGLIQPPPPPGPPPPPRTRVKWKIFGTFQIFNIWYYF